MIFQFTGEDLNPRGISSNYQFEDMPVNVIRFGIHQN